MNILLFGDALSDFASAMTTLFAWFFTELSAFTTWFFSDTLGQVIMFTVLISFTIYIIGYLISKVKN